MNVGIVGAGFIGNKRAQALSNFKDDKVIAVADVVIEKAKKLGEALGCEYFEDPLKVMSNPKIDAVIISTINKYLAPLSLQTLQAGKHVLCEKPLGVHSEEIRKCVKTTKKNKLIYKAGYNHRFHPGIAKAHELVKQGKVGKLMFIKASYGHGARPGYEKEWRAQKELSGGGELLDQGCHIIDLINWFIGKKPISIKAFLKTSYWKIDPLEDNAFVIMDFKDAAASFHTSWTQWKNEFIFEVYGQKGYVKINGLGGSYGKETLTVGERIPSKAPTDQIFEFKEPDNSWVLEWENLREGIKNPAKLQSSGKESLEVFEIIERIYQEK